MSRTTLEASHARTPAARRKPGNQSIPTPTRLPNGSCCCIGIRSALLVAIVTFVTSGCGPKLTAGEATARYSQELRGAVSASVAEPQRRTQMLAVVDRMEGVQLRFSQETTDFIRGYRKLNANYDADRPAFDQLFSDFNAKRLQARSEALDLHFQMAALASASEWRPIGRAESRLYEKTLEARQEGAK